jgi:ParB-like chromosome segregation protein Spo0J
MAIKINAGDVGRGDVFFIDPQEIIVDEKLNGRWEPHDEAAISSLVKSYEEEGQLQAVQVRKVAENRVQLVMG